MDFIFQIKKKYLTLDNNVIYNIMTINVVLYNIFSFILLVNYHSINFLKMKKHKVG